MGRVVRVYVTYFRYFVFLLVPRGVTLIVRGVHLGLVHMRARACSLLNVPQENECVLLWRAFEQPLLYQAFLRRQTIFSHVGFTGLERLLHV